MGHRERVAVHVEAKDGIGGGVEEPQPQPLAAARPDGRRIDRSRGRGDGVRRRDRRARCGARWPWRRASQGEEVPRRGWRGARPREAALRPAPWARSWRRVRARTPCGLEGELTGCTRGLRPLRGPVAHRPRRQALIARRPSLCHICSNSSRVHVVRRPTSGSFNSRVSPRSPVRTTVCSPKLPVTRSPRGVRHVL